MISAVSIRAAPRRCCSPKTSGYVSLGNGEFYIDKTMMGFGAAKRVVEEMVRAVE